jgi:outer membrane protein assembly factor BamB
MSPLRNTRQTLLLALPMVVLALALCESQTSSAQDVTTERYDNARTGATSAPGMNPDAVRNWKLLRSLPVDGIVYAQPLFLQNVPWTDGHSHNVIFVATSWDVVYAFDADTQTQLWRTQIGANDRSVVYLPKDPQHPGADSKALPGCNFLSPFGVRSDGTTYTAITVPMPNGQTTTQLPTGIGIESTPVLDRATGRLYVSYRTNLSPLDPNSPSRIPPPPAAPTAKQWLVALDIKTGNPLATTEITAAGFDLVWERSRASLLLSGGVVYVAFGSRCEDPGQPIFHGWIMAYDSITLEKVGELNVTPAFATFERPGPPRFLLDGGGIWQASHGIAADERGTIYFSTGNRRSEADLETHEPDTILADSFVRLKPVKQFARDIPGRGAHEYALQLAPELWFMPYRRRWLDAIDLDLGSAGIVLIPGTNSALGGGKQGLLYVLDRDAQYHQDAKFWNEEIADGAGTAVNRLTAVDLPEDFDADAGNVSQKMRLGVNQYVPAPIPGARVTALNNEFFGVGANGAVWAACQIADGEWPIRQISPPDFLPAGSHVASVVRQSTGQADLFFVGFDGALWTLFRISSAPCNTPPNPMVLSDNSNMSPWSAPIRLSNPTLFPPGANLTGVNRDSQREDVFVIDNQGAIRNFFVVDGGIWQEDVALSAATFALPDAGLAAIMHDGGREDVFAVSRFGSIEVFYRQNGQAWSVQGAHVLAPPNSVDPAACLAVVRRNGRQEDLFVVDKSGVLQTMFAANDNENWSAFGVFPIVPVTKTKPTASIAAALRGNSEEDVFLVDSAGNLEMFFEQNDSTFSQQGPLRRTTLLSRDTGGGLRGMTVPDNGEIPAGGGVAAVLRPLSGSPDSFGNAYAVTTDGHPTVFGGFNSDRQPVVKVLPVRAGLPMFDWGGWPHIHGAPVVARFSSRNGNEADTRMYVWAEKDHLKSYRWSSTHFDEKSETLAIGLDGRAALAPYNMPGGMLVVAVDSSNPSTGVVFASILKRNQACPVVGQNNCDTPYPDKYGSEFSSADFPGANGHLRAFDAITLREIWNNDNDPSYQFSKFVPPTIAGGRLYLPTASGKVLIYGPNN